MTHLLAGQKIAFSTPIEWVDHPLASAVDQYLNFGNKTAVQIEKGSYLANPKNVETTWIYTALKVASMLLTVGLLPLLALILKVCIRANHEFHWAVREQRGDSATQVTSSALSGIQRVGSQYISDPQSQISPPERAATFAAVAQDDSEFQYPNDRNIVLAAVNRSGTALQHAPEELRNDREIVLAAVNQNGGALQYASVELRNDRDVVLAAITKSRNAFSYASDELMRNDREVILKTALAFRGNLSILTYASEELRNDRGFILAAIHQLSGRALEYASEELRNDRDIVLAAVNRYGSALEYASVELRNDRDIVLAAVNQNGEALQYAAEALRNVQIA